MSNKRQKTNWINCVLTFCIQVMVLSLITSLPIHAVEVRGPKPGRSPIMQSASAQTGMAGLWIGVVEVSGIKIRLMLRVSQDAAGALTARLDVPDQGAADLPVEVMNVQGQVVRFEASNLGKYE